MRSRFSDEVVGEKSVSIAFRNHDGIRPVGLKGIKPNICWLTSSNSVKLSKSPLRLMRSWFIISTSSRLSLFLLMLVDEISNNPVK